MSTDKQAYAVKQLKPLFTLGCAYRLYAFKEATRTGNCYVRLFAIGYRVELDIQELVDVTWHVGQALQWKPKERKGAWHLYMKGQDIGGIAYWLDTALGYERNTLNLIVK